MLISLDHDGTYTLNPAFWDDFIKLAQEHGNAVHIVTLRDAVKDRLASERHLIDLGCMIIYCDGRPKKEVAKERGYSYAIWIEDDPRCIHEGSRLTDEQLAEWRSKDPYRAPGG